MNQSRFLNRFALLLLLAVTTLSACKKEKDPITPVPTDIATTVAGNYTFSELSYNGKVQTAAQADIKGTINLARKAATTVDMAIDLHIKSDGSEFIVSTINGIEAVDQGAGSVSLRNNGQEMAQVKNNKLIISGKDEDGIPFSITAAK